MSKKRPHATPARLVDCKAYRQALSCLMELGDAHDTVDTRAQCDAILGSVMELGLVLARADLHRRFPALVDDLDGSKIGPMIVHALPNTTP